MNSSDVIPGLVSTIIPVFNRPELVISAVESVLQQTYRPIEVIVVDDGSTDRTPDVLKRLAIEHDEVVVLTQDNRGPGAAREYGRRSVRGEYIQYLDSDDLLLPDKFRAQVEVLRKNPDCDVAYGISERLKLDQSPLGIALKGTGSKRDVMFPMFLRSRWWTTSTPLYRRSITDQAGPWSSLINEEDWEYDCRIASLGGRLAYVDQFVSIQRSHDDHLCAGGDTNPRKLAHRAQAQQLIYQHAKRYMELQTRPADIEPDDWQHFSKAVFLLARQCAAADLPQEAKSMLALSMKSGGVTLKHRVFMLLGHVFGWRTTAQLARLLER